MNFKSHLVVKDCPVVSNICAVFNAVMVAFTLV